MSSAKKACPTCQKTMTLQNFPKKGRGFRSECKACYKKRVQEWRRTPYGLLSVIYSSLKRNKRNDLPDRYLFYDRVVASPEFQDAYNRWESRGFRPGDKPVLVLDNPTLGYDIINIRWRTKKETICG